MFFQLNSSAWSSWNTDARPKSAQNDSLLYGADPAVIVPIGRAGEVHIGHQIQATLFQGLGQLYECFCLDSHFAYLVRLTAFIILDREGNSLIQIFYSGD